MEMTITHARYTAGQQVAAPHIHLEHTDAFYVLEGEQIGPEGLLRRVAVASLPDLTLPPGQDPRAVDCSQAASHSSRWRGASVSPANRAATALTPQVFALLPGPLRPHPYA
jgi:hypothetical protein